MKTKPQFLGWVSHKRADAPAHPSTWEKCGKLFFCGNSALLGMWMIPCPQMNPNTGGFEIKAVCKPHPGKEEAGSLPFLDGDIMLTTEVQIGEDGKKEYKSQKIGFITSRERDGDHSQYYVMYFFGQPLVRASSKGLLWLHIHLQ